ncbi:MAG: hypothetical protein SNJ84_04785 [Verrucomicrobiia bacterium]
MKWGWLLVGVWWMVGCGGQRSEPEEVRIEGIPLIEGQDLSEVVEVPVARPGRGQEVPVAWPERKTGGEPAFAPAKKLFRKPAFEPIDVEVLVIYVEGDLLPESWLQEWSRKEGLMAVQRVLPEDGQPPRDADVLLGPPERVARWAGAGLLREMPTGEGLVGLSRAFLGHAYDPEDRWSRPFRWTPFLFVACGERAGELRGRSLEELMKEPGAVWPDDPSLLGALRLKDQGASANTRRVSRQKQAVREAMSWTEGRRVVAGEGWRKVGEGKAALTFARAAGRITVPGSENVVWWFPEGGTLVTLQLASIPEFSDRPDAAERFIDFLLGEERQASLTGETGYFPVRLSSFDGLEVGGQALPVSRGWLDKAELMWQPGGRD